MKSFSKKPFNETKQNKGAKDTFEKFKIFTDRFWCFLMCVR